MSAENMTVLLVDDDEQDRLLYKEWLAADNYNVIEASNGDEALKACLATPPACVVVDFLMSKSDGFQFMIELRKVHQNDTPILFISGYETKQLVEDALALGASAFLGKKEMNEQSLRASIKKLVMGAT